MITIQLATESGFGSWFIRKYTWSPWSHVDIVLPTGDLLGARLKGGVQIREPGYAPFTHTVQREIDAPYSVIRAAKTQIGKPYDLMALVGIGLRRDWRNPDAWFCSELIAACFEMAYCPIFDSENLDRVTPRDIAINPLFKRV